MKMKVCENVSWSAFLIDSGTFIYNFECKFCSLEPPLKAFDRRIKVLIAHCDIVS